MNLKKAIIKRLTSKDWTTRFSLLGYLHIFCGERISDRYLRMLIVELREKDGVLILSSPHGYKIANTAKEFSAHIAYKESYAKSILHECKLMRRNFKRSTKPQLF